MSDERLRDLERRWRASGSVEDAAAWLVARVRAGGLAPARLELAAQCGDAAARRALGLPEGRPALPLDGWLDALAAAGPEVLVRAALAAVEAVLPAWRAWQRTPGAAPVPAVEAAVEALRAWVGCPCPVHREGVVAAWNEARGRWNAADVAGQVEASLAAAAAVDAARAAFGDLAWSTDRRRWEGVDDPARARAAACEAVRAACGARRTDPDLRGALEPRVRAAVELALCAWALS